MRWTGLIWGVRMQRGVRVIEIDRYPEVAYYY